MTMAIIEPVVMPVDDASFSSASAPVARIGDVSFCGDGLAGGGEVSTCDREALGGGGGGGGFRGGGVGGDGGLGGEGGDGGGGRFGMLRKVRHAEHRLHLHRLQLLVSELLHHGKHDS